MSFMVMKRRIEKIISKIAFNLDINGDVAFGHIPVCLFCDHSVFTWPVISLEGGINLFLPFRLSGL